MGPLPGRSMEERYGFKYLQRVGDDVGMEALPGLGRDAAAEKGGGFTSWQWLEKTFGVLRKETGEGAVVGKKVLTGRDDKLPR